MNKIALISIFFLTCITSKSQSPYQKIAGDSSVNIPQSTQQRIKALKEEIAQLSNQQWIKEQIESRTKQLNESYQTLIETKFNPDIVDWPKVVIEEKKIIVPRKK